MVHLFSTGRILDALSRLGFPATTENLAEACTYGMLKNRDPTETGGQAGEL